MGGVVHNPSCLVPLPARIYYWQMVPLLVAPSCYGRGNFTARFQSIGARCPAVCSEVFGAQSNFNPVTIAQRGSSGQSEALIAAAVAAFGVRWQCNPFASLGGEAIIFKLGASKLTSEVFTGQNRTNCNSFSRLKMKIVGDEGTDTILFPSHTFLTRKLPVLGSRSSYSTSSLSLTRVFTKDQITSPCGVL